MALASGTYKIVSALNGDNHVVQNNSGLFQLGVEDHGASRLPKAGLRFCAWHILAFI